MNNDQVTVKVFNANGCFVEPAAIAMIVNTVPTAGLNIPATVICTGDNAVFTANIVENAIYKFMINNVVVQNGTSNIYSTTNIVNNDIVTLQVTNSSLCSEISLPIIMNVNDNPAVDIVVSDNDICNGEDVIFTATDGYSNYNFFVNNSSIQNSNSNIYTSSVLNNTDIVSVIALSGNSCTAGSPDIIMNININPIAIITENTNPVCEGEDVTFTASGGTNYEFFVAGMSVQGPLNLTEFTTNSLNNGQTVTVEVTNESGCSDLADVIIMVEENPSVVLISSDDEICEGENVTFTATGNYDNYKFTINGIEVQNTASNSCSFNTLSNNDIVGVEVTNTANCAAEPSLITMTVHDNPITVLTPSATEICENEPITFTASSGYSNYDFKVNNILIQSGTLNEFTSSSLDDGSLITVDVYNTDNCSYSHPGVEINVNTLPTATLEASESTICIGENITLTASTGFTNYEFILNNITVQNGSANTYSSSEFGNLDNIIVKVTNSDDCQVTTLPVLITVNEIPEVNLIASDNEICENENIIFTATGGYTNYKFMIDGDEVQNSGANIYTNTGLTNSNVVSVEALNGEGCLAESPAIIVTVHDKPTAELDVNNNNICAGEDVTFTASGASLYEFFVSGVSVQGPSGNTSYISNSILDGQTVSVEVSDEYNCSDIYSGITMTVNDIPVVDLMASDTEICETYPVEFTATSGYENYKFMVNGFEVQNNENNIYTTTNLNNGDEVNVEATNLSACKAETANISIIVNSLPDASAITLSQTPASICSGNEVTFTASPGFSIYKFSKNTELVQTGSVNTYSSNIISDDDLISVEILNTENCSYNYPGILASINDSPDAVLNASSSVICTSEQVTFTATSGYENYKFFLNGQVVQNGAVNEYVSSGLENSDIVICEVANSNYCSTVTSPVIMTVSDSPVVLLTNNPDVICEGEQIIFTATPGYANYIFTVNDLPVQNSVVNTYVNSNLNNNDIVNVTATSAGDCSAIGSGIIVSVNNQPSATLISTETSICENEQVTFTASGGMNYEFFVSGLNVQGPSGLNQFTTSELTNGQSVSVSVSNSNGCYDVSSEIPITVNQLPDAVLLVSDNDICEGELINLTATEGYDNYKFMINNIVVQNGDNNNYSSINLADNDIVEVEVTNSTACSSSPASITMNIFDNPITVLIPTETEICENEQLTFTASSGYDTYEFSINDIILQTSNINTFTPTEISDNDFIKVEVFSSEGCSYLHNGITMSVNEIPVATIQASASTICVGEQVTFTATEGFENYEFLINEIPVQNGNSNIYNTTNISNNSIVRVNVTNLSGCSDLSLPVIMTVNEVPSVTLDVSDYNICEGETVLFTAQQGYVNYIFSVNGETVQTSAANTYSNSELSDADVVGVTVYNSGGCSASSVSIISVSDLPIADLSANNTTICSGETINFTASGGSVYQFFVDGVSVQGPDVATTYVSDNLTNGQTVSVAAFNLNNCFDISNEITVTINELPEAVLVASADEICFGESVTFTATGEYDNYDFKLNGIVVQTGSQNTYTSSELSTGDIVNVIIANTESCIFETEGVPIIVYPQPTATLTPSATIICESEQVVFTASLGFEYYEFYIEGIIAQAGSSNIFTANNLSDQELVSVITYNENNCSYSHAGINITVNNMPDASLDASATTICNGDNVEFTATEGFENYEFFLNNEQIQNGNDNTYSTTGLSNGDIITVNVTNQSACSVNTSPVIITVNEIPTVNLTNSANNICDGENIVFTATSGYINYEFTVNGIPAQTSSAYTFTTSNLSNGDIVNVTASNNGSCSAVASAIAITVSDIPVAGLISSGADICENENITFTASGGIVYEFFVDGLSVQGPSGQMTYSNNSMTDGQLVSVGVSNINNCLDISDNISVSVQPLPTATLVASADEICEGENVNFIAYAGYSNYTFFVNSIEKQTGSSNIYSSSVLSNDDLVSVEVENTANCSSLSENILMFVHEPPTALLVSSDDEICENEAVTFTVTDGYENYKFSINDSYVQFGTSNIYTTDNLSDGDIVGVEVVGNGGCSYSPPSIDIVVNSEPEVLLEASTTAICRGENVTFTVTEGYNAYQFFINDELVQNSSSNIYNTVNINNGDIIDVQVNNTTNCSANTNPVIMVVSEIPEVTLTSTLNNICTGEQVIFFATAGFVNYDFRINGNTVQNSPASTFTSNTFQDDDIITVLVTNSGGCSDISSAIALTVSNLPVANLQASETEICESEFITFTASGGSFYEFFIDGMSVQGPSGTTTYLTNSLLNGQTVTVNVMNSSYCLSQSEGITVSVSNAPNANISASDTDICSGNNVIFTAMPGYNNYKFRVNGIIVQDEEINTYSTTGLANNDVVTVEVENEFGCSIVSTGIIISVYNQATAALMSSDNDICNGESVVFTATTGFDYYTFMINDIPVYMGNSNIYTTASLSDGDIITVEVINPGNCTYTTPGVTITVNEIPIAELNATSTAICSGENVIFTATEGFENYVFILNGVEVQGGTDNTYSNSNLNNSDFISVRVTSNAGCEFTASPIIITVNEIPFVVLSYTSNDICENEPVTFTATNGYQNYEFFINDNSVQSSSSYIYNSSDFNNGDIVTVTATNSNECSGNSAAVIIIVNDLPDANLVSSATDLCEGETVVFTASGGTNYEFFVDGASVQGPSGITTYTTNTLTNGQTVTAEVINSNNCSVTTEGISVTVEDAPFSNLDVSEDEICENEEVVFTASLGFSNYIFKVNEIAVQNGVSNLYTTTEISDEDIVTVEIENASGCSSESPAITMTVYDIPDVDLIASDYEICENEFVTFTATPGFEFYNFIINGQLVQLSANNTYTTSDLENGDIVLVEITNDNNCSYTHVGIVMTVYDKPAQPLITTNSPVCENNQIVLSTTGAGDEYIWNIPLGINITTTVNFLTIEPAVLNDAGLYTVSIVQNDCASDLALPVAVVVDVSSPEVAYAGQDFLVCLDNGSAQLNAGNSIVSGSWSTESDAIIVTPNSYETYITNLNDGESYEFIWTLPSGACNISTSDNIIVNIAKMPVANSDNVTAAQNHTEEFINISINDSIWGNNYSIDIELYTENGDIEINSDYTINYTPIYEYIGKDEFIYNICVENCPELCDTATVFIDVTGELVIPDIITPNGDGVNDNLVIVGLEYYPENEVYIYNRWGNEVYHQINYQNDWSGTYENNLLPMGTYFFVVIDLRTGRLLEKGNFTLQK